ncbi:MAG TPA: type I-MYXAN CRISPR-associated endonuclease Cas1 [Pyrinomonadaceae bacterium]|nr:type I-MYXAN CRISPR-associated endonuclease Cas1 [Pyrinomonadaceae bacterium]
MTSANSSPLLRVQSLHALLYCERLFYLEEVEGVRLADAAIFAGRRLHVELEREEEGEWHSLTLQSERLGLRGKVDCLRRRDGSLIPYEHKRGRAARLDFGKDKTDASSQSSKPCAWPSDRVQVVAYAMLIEDVTEQSITEARVRYHQDNITVRVPVDESARAEVRRAIERARSLNSSVERPPVTTNERLCLKCSLAPACLPEEARRAAELTHTPSESIARAQMENHPGEPLAVTSASPETELPDDRSPDSVGPVSPAPQVVQTVARPILRLFPADDQRQSLHVVTTGARVGRAGDQIEVLAPDEPRQRHPVREIGQVVLHGFAQITTQALRLCADKEISVHWVTQGGSYVGSFSAGAGSVQRRIRQYEALRDGAFRRELARRLAEARILSQLRFLLRASRDRDRKAMGIAESIEGIRRLMPALRRAASTDEIRGVEGRAGALYFDALPALIDEGVDEQMKPDGRSRRPPRDRFNALIGFGYALLLKDVMSAILIVGLDPALGFYHTPRSQAHPLALDLIELFRVPMVDLPAVASINRRQWDAAADFSVTGQQVWLSDSGRRKMIEIYERRKSDVWKHPALGYSLSYARLVELEARLLEKEWTGEPGLFARMRLR